MLSEQVSDRLAASVRNGLTSLIDRGRFSEGKDYVKGPRHRHVRFSYGARRLHLLHPDVIIHSFLFPKEDLVNSSSTTMVTMCPLRLWDCDISITKTETCAFRQSDRLSTSQLPDYQNHFIQPLNQMRASNVGNNPSLHRKTVYAQLL